MKIRKGKDWVDEGPSTHHSIHGYTSGGESIGRAKPVLTAGGLITQTKAQREKKKKEKEESLPQPENIFRKFQIKPKKKK